MRKLIVSVFALLYSSSVFASAGNKQVEKAMTTEDTKQAKVVAKSKSSGEAPSVEAQMAELAQDLQKIDDETKKFASLRERGTVSESGVSSLELGAEPKKLENIKALKLNEISSVDFFKNPNAFASCLEPGHWIEVPHSTNGGGWSASLLVSKEILQPILEGKIDGISSVLVNQEILKSRAPDDKAFVDTIKYAFEGLINYDEATKKDLENLKLCELTSYPEFLKENGLERFDNGDEFSERPQVGLPVRYSDGRVVIDSDALRKTLSKRLNVAQKLNEIKKEIGSISKDRNKIITPSTEKKLAEMKRVSEENIALRKKVEEGKDLKNDVTEFETQLKENEEKLKSLELDRKIQRATMFEEEFEQKFQDQLEEAENCFIRLSALDPSSVSEEAISAKKISKEAREKAEELKLLKQKNEELKRKIDAEKAKSKEVIVQLENEKKKAEEELAKANQMPGTIMQGSGRYGNNIINNPARQQAIATANAKIAKIDAKLKEAAGSSSNEFEKQYEENSTKIKAYKADKNIIAALRRLEAR